MNFKLENNEIKRWILKNGIYKMIDEDNQEILFKIKETDKTIIFELIGERPYLTLGDMDMFIYNQKNKKRTIKKIGSGHAIRVINGERFILYPYQSGNPYLFQCLKESGE